MFIIPWPGWARWFPSPMFIYPLEVKNCCKKLSPGFVSWKSWVKRCYFTGKRTLNIIVFGIPGYLQLVFYTYERIWKIWQLSEHARRIFPWQTKKSHTLYQGVPILYSYKWSYGAPINGLIHGQLCIITPYKWGCNFVQPKLYNWYRPTLHSFKSFEGSSLLVFLLGPILRCSNVCCSQMCTWNGRS